MNSAKATAEQRKQVKDACLDILSTFEDTIMTTSEITDLVVQEYPHLAEIINTHGKGDKSLTGQVLFQISQNLSGEYAHIQNTSRGRYVFSKTRLPRRTDIPSYRVNIPGVQRSLPRSRYMPTPKTTPAPKPIPVAEPVVEPEAIEVKEAVQEHTSIVIDGAPNFTFVGKISGRYLVRNDKGTLYVLQPAELA